MESLQGKVLSGGVEAQELARAGIEYALLRVADAEAVFATLRRTLAPSFRYASGRAGRRGRPCCALPPAGSGYPARRG